MVGPTAACAGVAAKTGIATIALNKTVKIFFMELFLLTFLRIPVGVTPKLSLMFLLSASFQGMEAL
jgi:hypothetical protein